ncbi:hypothetical protein TKK_0005180 [Trichogramma kaykai]
MKPIPGETVQSIIHGPADAGHIREMSQFLRRQINVWGKERSMLFGRCHHRQPHVILAHSRAGDAAAAAAAAGGHFSLSGGSEPRNPEADRRPNNCAFDCVSDQTGYPAPILRQIVAQRMLVKLYHARLRGRDYQFQCSRCSVSGGNHPFTEKEAKALVEFSKKYRGHAHLHWLNPNCKECKKRPEIMCCMTRYVKVIRKGNLRSPKSLFASESDMLKHLVMIMNGEEGKKAKKCLENNRVSKICNEVRFDRKGKAVVDMYLNEPFKAYKFYYKIPKPEYKPFHATWIIMILKNSQDRQRSKLDILTIYPSDEQAKVEILPLSVPNPINERIEEQDQANQGTEHDSPSRSASQDQPIQRKNQGSRGTSKKRKYRRTIKVVVNIGKSQVTKSSNRRKKKKRTTTKKQKQGNQGEKKNPENPKSSQIQGNQGEKKNPKNPKSSQIRGNQGEKKNPKNPKSSQIQGNQGEKKNPKNPKSSQIQGNQGEKKNPKNPKSSQIQGNQGEKKNPKNPKSSQIQGNKGEKKDTEIPKSSQIQGNEGKKKDTEIPTSSQKQVREKTEEEKRKRLIKKTKRSITSVPDCIGLGGGNNKKVLWPPSLRQSESN